MSVTPLSPPIKLSFYFLIFLGGGWLLNEDEEETKKVKGNVFSALSEKKLVNFLKKWHLILFIKKSIKRPYSSQVCKRCAFQGRARANPLHQLMTALITQSWLANEGTVAGRSPRRA